MPSKDPAWYEKVLEARAKARGPNRRIPGESEHQQRYRERAERAKAVVCDQGHELRPGPWGMQICDTCTAIAVTQLRRKLV